MKNKAVLALLALSLFLSFETVRTRLPQVLFQQEGTDSVERGLMIDPYSPDLNFRAARVYHNLMLTDQEKVKELLVKSISGNPLISSAWLDLSELLIDEGEQENALKTLNMARRTAPLSVARIWQGGLLYLRLDKPENAYSNFRHVADSDPQSQRKVFYTSLQVEEDPDIILDKIVSDKTLPRYLAFLMETGNRDLTYGAWSRLERSKNDIPEGLAMSYTDYLVGVLDYPQALKVWKAVMPAQDDGSLIVNGSFEHEPYNRGLDWRLGDDSEGVFISYDWKYVYAGENSLMIEFDGAHNPDFKDVYQYVPVNNNTRYVFSSAMASENIDSVTGVQWEIMCPEDYGAMYAATEPVTGTNEWKVVSLDIRTPENCNGLVVVLRRHKSNDALNKYISGKVRVDDVKLVEADNG